MYKVNLLGSNILSQKFAEIVRVNAGKRSKRAFPDRDLKYPEPGNFSSGPEKSGIGKSLQSLGCIANVTKQYVL